MRYLSSLAEGLAGTVHNPEVRIIFCHCNQAIGPLDTIGVDLDAAIFQEAYQARPALEPVTDRLGNGTLLRHGSELGFQPGFEAFDQGLDLRLSHGAAPSLLARYQRTAYANATNKRRA
jgi:hypothetical protein